MPAESAADLASLDGMGMGRRESGNMARNASTRSLATAPGSSLSKLESIASTAVRAADKVGVRLAGSLWAHRVEKGAQELHLTQAVVSIQRIVTLFKQWQRHSRSSRPNLKTLREI